MGAGHNHRLYESQIYEDAGDQGDQAAAAVADYYSLLRRRFIEVVDEKSTSRSQSARAFRRALHDTTERFVKSLREDLGEDFGELGTQSPPLSS